MSEKEDKNKKIDIINEEIYEDNSQLNLMGDINMELKDLKTHINRLAEMHEKVLDEDARISFNNLVTENIDCIDKNTIDIENKESSIRKRIDELRKEKNNLLKEEEDSDEDEDI